MDNPNESVADTVCAVISQVADKPCTLASSLVDDLGLDSLEMIEAVVELENKFTIDIPFEQARLSTVADVVRYIEDIRSKQPQP